MNSPKLTMGLASCNPICDKLRRWDGQGREARRRSRFAAYSKGHIDRAGAECRTPVRRYDGAGWDGVQPYRRHKQGGHEAKFQQGGKNAHSAAKMG